MPNPNKVLSEIINKTEDLSNKVTLNDLTKTYDASKKLIKGFLKSFWNKNNSNKKMK